VEQWDDLNFESRTISTHPKDDKYGYLAGTKMMRSRVIPMMDMLYETLKKLPRRGDLVFPSPNDSSHPRDINSVNRRLKKYLAKLGIEELLYILPDILSYRGLSPRTPL